MCVAEGAEEGGRVAARDHTAEEPSAMSPATISAAEAAEQEAIHVLGARVHNLKDISFDIPHNAITRRHGGFGIGEIESGV